MKDSRKTKQNGEMRFESLIYNHKQKPRNKKARMDGYKEHGGQKWNQLENWRKIRGEKAYIFGGVKSESGNLRSIESGMDRPENSLQS